MRLRSRKTGLQVSLILFDVPDIINLCAAQDNELWRGAVARVVSSTFSLQFLPNVLPVPHPPAKRLLLVPTRPPAAELRDQEQLHPPTRPPAAELRDPPARPIRQQRATRRRPRKEVGSVIYVSSLRKKSFWVHLPRISFPVSPNTISDVSPT